MWPPVLPDRKRCQPSAVPSARKVNTFSSLRAWRLALRSSPCTVFCSAAAPRSRRCCDHLGHPKHMPQTLLLRLPPAGQEETEWLTLDETGAPTPTRQRGSLSLAAAVWRTGRVVVLAPSTQILLAEPELPPGSGTKLARAVPFALEEQLTEDVDQLSFAIGQRRSHGRIPVAVVSRSVLQGWIADLSAAGLDPQSIYADISA